MYLRQIEEIKKMSIVALISDDYLMETLVLKGGNAIDLIHKISARASWDLDFSMEGDFDKDRLDEIGEKIRKNLVDVFKEKNYDAFDINFSERPENPKPDTADFWGGYLIEFKIIEHEKYNELKGDLDAIRRNAAVLADNQIRTFRIEISKYEYCAPKIMRNIDNYSIHVYPTEMLVIEKLRAICQQISEYLKIVTTHKPRPRAKDFFDIYILMENFDIDLTAIENKKLIKEVFRIKKVPLSFLAKIKENRSFHSADFNSLRNTVLNVSELKDFDYYFDFIINEVEKLKTLWKK